ncbi:MAG: substrate-binding domain-containing protein [Tannerella sp.]|jgi:LacI family transcriptional regulator|nr:substrate-binding domain-containing protein [Tannerella sp.]
MKKKTAKKPKKTNCRIVDIAAIAGVSAGTVDRVLHDRGRVSEEVRERVRRVIAEVHYQPASAVRSSVSEKPCRILSLIPAFLPDEYWSKVNDGIRRAEQEYADFHVEVKHLSFDQYDKNSFDTVIRSIKKMEVQGVIIATLFRKSVLRLAQWLDNQKTPYVLMDAWVEDTNCIAYNGTDSFQSGYLGGRLLLEQIRKDDSVLIFNVMDHTRFESTQCAQREEGFRSYLSRAGFQGEIHSAFIMAKSPAKNEQLLNRLIQPGNGYRGGIMFNSRVGMVASWFLKREKFDFVLVGYDTIKANIPYLKNGIVSHLIAQRPEAQGYNSVKALFRHLVLKQPVEKMNYMPVDILVKENIDCYNNYI